MKHILLFIGMVIPFQMGLAQNIVSGTVHHSENNLPLMQVSVYFPELEKGTTTNADGQFELNDIPNGSFEIVISSIGFETFSQILEIGFNTNKIDISLAPSAIEMEEVIVSTPFHKLQSENVMKVEQANIKDLKVNGAVTLSDGITKISGVEIISTGIGIGKPVIRGLSSNRVLVYTQGVRLENQQFGGEHGLGINDAGIESVEVIKGPASLLYGSDAMGGVLYFNPEKFANSRSTEGDLNLNYYANTRGTDVNAGLRSSGENLKFLLRGSYASHIDYKTGGNERLTNSRFNAYDLKAGLAYQATTFKTEFRYNYNLSQLGIPEKISEQTKFRTPELPFQHIGNHILSSKTKIFLEKSSFEATFGYIFNNRKEFEDEQDIPTLEMHLATFNYNLQYEMPKWGNLETIVGLQGMRQTNKNFAEEILIPDAKTNDFGVLATSQLHLANGNAVQMGLRFDHRNIESEPNSKPIEESTRSGLNRDFNSFNAALGYKMKLSEKTVARIHLASGFRAPNLAELTSNGVHEGTNRYEIGNTDLANEQNLQTDISLEYKNKHLEFFVNGFYNSVKDFIFIEANGDTIGEDEVFVYQQQNAKLYGGELGFHVRPHPLDWLHFESSFETVIGKQTNGQYLPLMPANSLNNTLRVEKNNESHRLKTKYAFVTLETVFAQHKVEELETSSEGYNLVHLGFGANFSAFKFPMEVRLSGKNIFNKTYISHLSRLKTDRIPNIGRNIVLAISIPI